MLSYSKILFIIFFAFIFKGIKAQESNGNVIIVNKPYSHVTEIRNGLLGIVIPMENSFSASSKNVLAPIQSVIYRDGAYSNDSAVYLHSPTTPLSMKVSFLKSTSEVCIVSILYTFNKPQFIYGNQTYKGGDAGTGYYKSTLTVKKNSKSIIIEDEADYDINYEFKISNDLHLNKARYRGWRSSSADEGHDESGAVYQNINQLNNSRDAIIDLSFDKNKAYSFLSFWGPTGGEMNSGRYWQIFNANEPANANLLGFFQGRASRLIAARSVGVCLVTYKANNADVSKSNNAALQINITRRGPDNIFFGKKRFEWALFVSTKQDLLPVDQYQPIGKELNLISGMSSKIDDYLRKPASPVPALFNGTLYSSADKIQTLIARIKKDDAFAKMIIASDPYFKTIADAWKYPDSAKSLTNNLVQYGENLKKAFRDQDGIYQYGIAYWGGASNFKGFVLEASCLFADKSNVIAPEQKESIQQTIRMMARIIWDNDNVPFFDSAGVNYGPQNMYYMYQNNGRNFFALLFANDPEFKERAKKVLDITRKNLLDAIAENGSGFGTPHYTQPTIEPILYSMLQLKNAGLGNLFAEQDVRIKKFIDFYNSLLTPGSVRFNGNRKLISFGDGTEESAAVYGLLASGFEDSDPALSKSLYSIYQNGPARLSTFGYIELAADVTANYSVPFNSSSSNYVGYLSHFRAGVGSEYESAVWILNGDHYSDHRNDDAGEFAIYALGVPLSLSRSCFYYPAATDSKIRSVVIPEEMFPEWNKANQPINGRSLTNRTWPVSSQNEFAKLNSSTFSSSKMNNGNTEWQRLVAMININASQPVIIFFDSINNNKQNIWSMMNMSQGSIKTPAGDISPVDKIYDARNKNLQQLPEATAEKGLKAALNKFSFIGQDWSKKLQKSGGIDWDLYALSKGNTSFTLSQWTNNWENSVEQAEFTKTNNRPYSETQQIIRLESDAPFFNVLLPYLKGTEPYKNNVSLIAPDKMKIKYGEGELLITAQSYFYSDKNKSILSTFTSTHVAENGFSIEGGITEVELIGNDIKIRIHGNSGKRIITIPGQFIANKKNSDVQIMQKNKSTLITIDYQNSKADLLSSEQGYTEYTFKKS